MSQAKLIEKSQEKPSQESAVNKWRRALADKIAPPEKNEKRNYQVIKLVSEEAEISTSRGTTSPAMIKAVPTPYNDQLDDLRTAQLPAETGSESATQALPRLLPTQDSAPIEEGSTPSLSSSPIIPPTPDGLPTTEDSLATIFRPITNIQPYYAYSPTGETPHEYLCPQPGDIPEEDRARCPEFLSLPAQGTVDRLFYDQTFYWCASNVYHNPLYFEDVGLERYGHSICEPLQPFVSLGKFGVQAIGLPYQMALDPVWNRQYALGHYRPGDHAPTLIYPVPINLKAAAAAGGVYTGLIFLFP